MHQCKFPCCGNNRNVQNQWKIAHIDKSWSTLFILCIHCYSIGWNCICWASIEPRNDQTRSFYSQQVANICGATIEPSKLVRHVPLSLGKDLRGWQIYPDSSIFTIYLKCLSHSKAFFIESKNNKNYSSTRSCRVVIFWVHLKVD